ncbi:aldo/keto reductase [Planctopirus hydrillae]|uniref:Aldo/keto reductase n=1 Tax=Planctopirus hydrillae TaxID=1841610 RepID=A0A1C3E8W8_9PLAN|nr:aldo/keto reductase [Planctopirus hydrillae]ODA29680.1 aldo/keto reductase [Planctopirus hydrillae]
MSAPTDSSVSSQPGPVLPELRTLGTTDIRVTAIAMGCWPIAGITTQGVTWPRSLATLQAAFDAGINFFDTAYCYGYEGESERLIAEALGHVRDKIVIASKGGIHWSADRVQVKDGRPETIIRQCEESLQRLGTDVIDLYYLHSPDPQVPVEISAEAFLRLFEQGKIRSAGLSNATLEQLSAFHRVCPLSAYQPRYNMVQREIEQSQLPWCRENEVSCIVYWPLMKGLLAGHYPREHVFPPADSRHKYAVFQGQEWQRNQDLLDELKAIATRCDLSVARLVLQWTIQRQGITSALCGAHRPEQIQENAFAMVGKLSHEALLEIESAIARRDLS